MSLHRSRVPSLVRAALLLFGAGAIAGLWGASVTAPRAAPAVEPPAAGKLRVYAGTYTGAKSKGIYLLGAGPGFGRAGPAGPGGHDHKPLVPGSAPEPAVPCTR